MDVLGEKGKELEEGLEDAAWCSNASDLRESSAGLEMGSQCAASKL